VGFLTRAIAFRSGLLISIGNIYKKRFWHGHCILPWCISARPCLPAGWRQWKERDDGIRETLWPARDGAPAAQPAHDDARVEHRERRDAELQGTRHRLRQGARPRAAGSLDRGRDLLPCAR